MSLQQSHIHPKAVPNPLAPLGGWIIDQNGHEITITEEMVQHACKVLEESRKDLAKKD